MCLLGNVTWVRYVRNPKVSPFVFGNVTCLPFGDTSFFFGDVTPSVFFGDVTSYALKIFFLAM